MQKKQIIKSYRNSLKKDMDTDENKFLDWERDNSSHVECLFCIKFGTQPFKKIDFGPLLNRALHTKYATHTSVNQMDISQIIEKQQVKWVIDFNDQVQLEEDYEYITKYYGNKERQNKFKALQEYFKYHKDIPRLFMKQLGIMAVNYFEKQKHLKYKKIKRMLGIPFDERTHQETEVFNTEGEIFKNKNQMILNEITLEPKFHIIAQDQVSYISSQSLLMEFQRNQSSFSKNINVSDTWVSMNTSVLDNRLIIDQFYSTPHLNKRPNEPKKQNFHSNSNQLSQQRLQGLLMQPKYESVPTNQNQPTQQSLKTSFVSKKQQQELLIRQLIYESCFKKKNKSTKQFNTSSGFQSMQVPQQQNSPQFSPSKLIRTISKPQLTSATKIGLPPTIYLSQLQENKLIRSIYPRKSDTIIIPPGVYQKPNMKTSQIYEKNQIYSQKNQSPKLTLIKSKSIEILKKELLMNSNYQAPQKISKLEEYVEDNKAPYRNKLQSHKKSYTYYTEQSFSPNPLISFKIQNLNQNQKASLNSSKKLSLLMSMEQPKQKILTSQRGQIQAHQSQPSINININQLNMNGMHFQNPGNSTNNRIAKSSQQSQSLHSIIKKSSQHYSNNYYHNKNPSIQTVSNSPDKMKIKFNSKISVRNS